MIKWVIHLFVRPSLVATLKDQREERRLSLAKHQQAVNYSTAMVQYCSQEISRLDANIKELTEAKEKENAREVLG